MDRRPLLVTMVSLLALTGCKEKVSPAEAAAQLKAAQVAYEAKDFPAALKAVQSALKGDPRSGDAHYLAGEIQEGLGDKKAAFEEYARAAVPDANSLKAQLKVAQILIDAKQIDAALGRINSSLGSHPNDPDVLALRALAEQRQGSADKARADAQAALGRAPGHAMASAVLATDALMAKNIDKASELLATGLKTHPDDPTLIRLKAAALAGQNKPDDAIALYADMVARDPASPQNRLALAELEAGAGRTDDGEHVLRDGVALAPDKTDMRLALLSFLARHRDAASVDRELLAAIAAHPQDSGFDLLRADQMQRAGHTDEAASTLATAVTRLADGPGRQAAQLALARLDLDRGETEDARKLLEAVLTAKPDQDDALLMRATLALRADEAARAIPDLLAVAGRQPRSSLAFSLLSDAYVQQGDFDKATDALKKVAYFEPANFVAAQRLADLGLKAGKPDAAKAALADFIARNPDAIEARIAAVRLAEQAKDWAGAQAVIDGLRRLPKADRVSALLSAELLEAKNQPDLAMAAYGKLLDPAPGRPLDRDALQAYGRSATAAKQGEAAVATLASLAAKLDGSDAAAADLVVSALRRSLGQADQAMAAAAAAIAAAPKEAGGYLATADLQRDNLGQAVATLNGGLAAGAPAEPLLLTRGSLQDIANDRDAALASYSDALKSNPRSVVAANNYASVLADLRPTDGAALKQARQPLQRFADANNGAVLDTLAWLDYRLGDFSAAKGLLMRAKADASPNPQLRYHYGAVLIALGERQAGKSAVRAALSQPFPGHDEAARLLTE
ncbi:tetratricopeptide repeat protein [Lichenihabitans sp. Uapishka_5]|uniref:tetratricopeptide repeat protein n=1 Tax=Lichenihabitans sp. Uapishka_5 TaxID=3037302 RepID=UPI0029E7FC3B|nr:tetratricopeptide repeat protein [Lichenihabitans sp. Uapishka_5]MDX7950652.1 tetratricopeptide repeat protein [Lichenihabitans sp. Uapishka_5]